MRCRIEVLLWMTDRDLSSVLSHIENDVLCLAMQTMSFLLKRRVFMLLSNERKEYVIKCEHESSLQAVHEACTVIERVVSELYEVGEIGNIDQRYIA